MADKRCVSPGDDSRTPGQWLNREAAERLLSGESPEVADASARVQAERLAKALGALSADAAPAGAELPGEQAALAAFRKAREAAAEEAVVGRRGEPSARRSDRSPDAGLIRIGGASRAARRPRWARPVRFALAASLAVGMVGGVAVAAGTGALPTPFGDDRPGPAASVSAAAPAEHPDGSPSGDSVQGGTSGAPTSGATASGTPGGSSPDTVGRHGRDDKGTDRGGATDSAVEPGGTGTWWRDAAEACRDVREGRTLGTHRRRALEGAAGGAARVWKYCKRVLDAAGDASGDDGQDHGGRGDRDDRDGHGSGGDGRQHDGGNDHHQDGGSVLPAPSAFAPVLPARPLKSPVPSPSPTYSAL